MRSPAEVSVAAEHAGLGQCAICGTPGGVRVHRTASVPVNSCLLVGSREEAVDTPRGELDIILCTVCGFVANRAFDPGLTVYSGRYEDSQAFSGTFVRYAEGLARLWVETTGLTDGTVVEIGAGRGDFSRMLLAAGAGRVVAMDPTIDLHRVGDDADGRIEWQARAFDESSGLPECSAVVMRHVLEHVPDPLGLLTNLHRELAARPEVAVLVEIPEATRIGQQAAFWDVYYEHCAYFTADSARNLFEAAGFEVDDVACAFGDQYLLIRAHASARPDETHWRAPDSEALRPWRTFADRVEQQVGQWRDDLAAATRAGRDVVLWGSGSKPTGFLAELGEAGRSVSRVVDVNPHKHGQFMLGSGLPIVGPDDLQRQPPELVVVMNALYENEIRADLVGRGIVTQVLALGG